ncbi:MAG: hypothetical protein Q7T61_01005 [Caulobacter sp.]|nr:hypothetical protein [Caulobacter sp.]
MSDTLAKAAADRSAELVGTHTDMVFPDWENANPGMKEFWREIVSAVTGSAAKHPDKAEKPAKAEEPRADKPAPKKPATKKAKQ